MSAKNASSRSRRDFLQTTAVSSVATTAMLAAPRVVTASRTADSLIIGEGDYRYEVLHGWPQLPDEYQWHITHGVAFDSAGFLYVFHLGRGGNNDHPTIFVFDPSGAFVRAFGQEYKGGGHGIEIRKEGNEEFLYLSVVGGHKIVVKMTLSGEVVWQKTTPMESGVYGDPENPENARRARYRPTNITFMGEDDFLVADGYGSFYIHHYDKEGNWKSSFGGRGEGNGTFHTPHGLWIDDRGGREPTLVVTDRAHHTLQYLTLEGEYIETMDGFGLPANIDTRGDLMLVPELVARISLLDGENNVVAQLGDDVERIGADSDKEIRRRPESWIDGKFVHPHDACFDADGNIFVAEWVPSGRITKLRHVG